MRFLKTENRNYCLTWTYAKESCNQKDTCTLIFLEALFAIAGYASNLNAVHHSRGMVEEDEVTYMMEYYSSESEKE